MPVLTAAVPRPDEEDDDVSPPVGEDDGARPAAFLGTDTGPADAGEPRVETCGDMACTKGLVGGESYESSDSLLSCMGRARPRDDVREAEAVAPVERAVVGVGPADVPAPAPFLLAEPVTPGLPVPAELTASCRGVDVDVLTATAERGEAALLPFATDSARACQRAALSSASSSVIFAVVRALTGVVTATPAPLASLALVAKEETRLPSLDAMKTPAQARIRWAWWRRLQKRDFGGGVPRTCAVSPRNSMPNREKYTKQGK